MDVIAGGGNQVEISSFNLERLHEGIASFYSVYPSISLKSKGQHSGFDLDYTFSGEYFQTDPGLFSASHSADASFAAQLGNRTRLKLSNRFSTFPEYSTLSVLKGIVMTPEGFQYLVEPQLYKSSSLSDSGSIGLDLDLTTKSSLTFAGSGSYRHYNGTVSGSYFSDQVRAEGSLGFSHKHSSRTTWSLKYAYWQNGYRNYATSRSHSATLGLSRVLSPGLSLTLEAGPAYVETESHAGAMVLAAAPAGKASTAVPTARRAAAPATVPERGPK